MNLKEELLRGIYAYGFEKPSAIQQRAIMPCVKGHDVIAQAQSGKKYSLSNMYYLFENIRKSVIQVILATFIQVTQCAHLYICIS